MGSLANSFYGFSRDGGVDDIAGIWISNSDAAGIGFDNLKHDVASNVPPPSATPEPSAGALMLVGLGALAGAHGVVDGPALASPRRGRTALR